MFADSYLLSPYIVMFSPVFKYCCIQRESFKRKFICIRTSHLTFLCPDSCKRICICTFQHIWADCPDIIFVPACKIDIPFTIQIMKLRRPDMFAHDSFFMFLPDCHFFRIFQSCQSFASSQHNPVIGRYGCCKIIVSICVAVNIWICSLQNPWLIILKFFTHCMSPCLLFILGLYKLFFIYLKLYCIFQKISTIFFSFRCTFFADSL